MKKRVCLIAITVLFIIFGIRFVQAVDYSELEQRRIELRQKISEAGQSLENINVELTENLEQISKLDEEIGGYETEVENINKNLESLNQQIIETENNLNTIEERLQKQQQLLQKRVVFAYEEGQTRYLDVLLNSKSIIDFISRYYLISEIAQYDKDLLDNITKEKEEISEIEKNLVTSKENLKKLKNEQKKRMVSLENSKVIRSSYANKLSKEEMKIQEEINLYQQELDLMDLEVLMAALNSNGNTQYVGGAFAWPAPGYYTITSPYGMRTHPILKSYRNHTGMDIGAPLGSYAIAANDGIVTKSTYSNSYGNMVMIDHGGGVVTLYAHGSELIAQVGDVVKRGDAIMKVGSTGWSTGPHLHFEIRINGKAIDPYPYLISSVQR